MLKSAVDATTNFTLDQVKEMEELIEINEQLKTLDSRKKALVDNIKSYLTKAGISNVDVNGRAISITESQRRTVTSKTKDAFIAELVSMGKNYLVTTKIEPDLDSIFAEVDAETLEQDFVDKYVKVTPILTLRVN